LPLAHAASRLALGVAALLVAAPARASLLACEEFRYTSGATLNGSGGTGWSGAWSGGSFVVASAGLSDSPLSTLGLAAEFSSALLPLTSSVTRSLSASLGSTTATRWVSFLLKPDRTGLTDGIGLTIGNSGGGQVYVGYTGTNYTMSNSGSGGGTTVNTAGAASGTAALIVVKIRFAASGKDTVTYFLNPTPGLSSPDVSESSAKEDVDLGTFTDFAVSAQQGLLLTNHAQLDEIRIGTSYADVSPSVRAISGKVFEDVDYGGGAGRNWTTASGNGGSARASARVELFDDAGAFTASTTTDGSGNYSFTSLPAEAYLVRVTAASVTSSRTGYTSSLLPVLTYRTDASSSTATGVTDHVGGTSPATADAASAASGWVLSTAGSFSGSGSGTAHAFAPATIVTADVTGVDFGFNFDTVVNRNDSGIGSLRQAITNANALANAGLAQSGLTAGVENALPMLADGSAHAGLNTGYASQFAGGVATFRPASALPGITDPIVLDARLQPGWTSSPLLQLSGNTAGSSANGFDVTAGSSTIAGFIVNRFTGTNKAGIRLATGGGDVVKACWIGTDSTGSAAAGNYQGVRIESSSNDAIGGTGSSDGNVVTGSTGAGVWLSAGTGDAIERNAIYGNGGIGIDLGGDGVTANDGTTSGALPNDGMDFPVFTSAVLAGGSLNVIGYVGSAPGQSAFGNARIELYKSDNDPTGYGEGSSYLGALTTDANGRFSGTLAAAGVALGDKVSATATDGSGNTSEFGADSTVRALTMVKRVFDSSGNPVASGTTLAKGTIVRFLLYVDDRCGAITDVRLSDVLDPAFAYVAGTMTAADVTADCSALTCTAPEEATILAAALAGTALTDAVDGDAGAVSGTTIQLGKANAGSAQLDLAAGKVYAVVFRARMK
jgi:hypothetical protein